MLNIQFTKIALLLASLLSNKGSTVTAAPDAANIVPFSTIGNIAALENSPGGGSRLYSQNANGDIVQTCIHGPFTTGSSSASSCGAEAASFIVVPANETMYGTPIAATGLEETNGGQIHLFFLSPDRIINEYIRGSTDFIWKSGPSCTQCITNEAFLVAEGSEALYAMGSTSHALRVGFVSAGSPGTLTEAVYNSNNGHWQTAGLPN